MADCFYVNPEWQGRDVNVFAEVNAVEMGRSIHFLERHNPYHQFLAEDAQGKCYGIRTLWPLPSPVTKTMMRTALLTVMCFALLNRCSRSYSRLITPTLRSSSGHNLPTVCSTRCHSPEVKFNVERCIGTSIACRRSRMQ